jgi:flagellar hook-associated protein 2
MTVSIATAGSNVIAPVTEQGLGSGQNISSLVTSLVSATIEPQQTLLQASQTTDQATISALGTLQSTLSSLQSAEAALTTGGALTQMTASSSDSSVFTATAGTGAVAGTYQVQVQTLAQGNTLESTEFSSQNATVGTGPYTFTAGGSSFSVTLDSSDDTLSGLAQAINGASDNSGVSASIINGTGGSYLLLSATQTGTANAVSVASSSPISFSSIQGATDATGTIDNLPFDSASNIVANALSNVTLNLASASPDTTQTLTVGADTSSAANAVQTFVSAYNSALQLLTSDTAYTPSTTSSSSSSSSSGTAGPLLGDVAIEGVMQQLQSIVGGSTTGSGVFSMLSQVGVSTNSDGTLSLNSTELQSALQQDPQAVQSLFSGSKGIGTQLDTLLNSVAGASGMIDTETNAQQTDINNINNQLSLLTQQSTTLTAQYNAEFNAMDNIVAAYKSTESLLTQLYTPQTSSDSSSSSS